MKNRLIHRFFDLQLFTDGTAAGEGAGSAAGDPEKDEDGGADDEGDGKEPKTFTQDEVDRIVSDRIARERRDAEKAIKNAKDEAAKYAKMSEEEKRKADEAARLKEIEDLKAENARLQAEAMKAELGKGAAADLEKKEIAVTPDILEFVVGTDAESTKTRTDKFIKAILADRKAQEVKRATKQTPKGYGDGGGPSDPFAARMKKYGR